MGEKRDYIGITKGKLTVIGSEWRGKSTYINVRCECGTEKWIRADTLNKIVSCGCYNTEHNLVKERDIKGQKFGMLTAIRNTGKRSKQNGAIWEFLCDCGTSKEIEARNVLHSTTISCGCVKEAKYKTEVKNIHKKCHEKYYKDGTSISSLTMAIPSTNTSGIKGVCWDKNRSKWVAQITFKGKNHRLGRYETKEEAAEARAVAEEKLFGAFLNGLDHIPKPIKKRNTKRHTP